MRITHKRDILEINDDELTSWYNLVEKIVLRRKQAGFIKRLDLTWDEEEIAENIYHRLSPLFGVDSSTMKREVNIASNPKTTESYK
jgi:hypothetical protein